MMAAMVFTNLLYLVGAIAAATLVSALIVFRHRKPKSLEAGIELFTLEMQALAPESRTGPPGTDRGDLRRSGRPLAGSGRPPRGGTRGSGVTTSRLGRAVGPLEGQRHLSGSEAVGPAPETEDQAG